MAEYKASFDLVVSELNSDYYTLKNANRVFRKQVELRHWGTNCLKPLWKYTNRVGYTGCCSISSKYNNHFEFRCVFGLFIYEFSDFIPNLKPYPKYYALNLGENFWRTRKDKCGVEVVGMKPNRTKDGKYKYEGISIKELKESCKNNGLKGFSGKDKCELVAMLMKV
jgi:hypothetical protein